MTPKVSIIIPIYNVAKYIEKCVRSVLEQTFQDIEYIFVNDCTTDNSIEILHSILKSYPNKNVKIIHNEINKGLAESRDVGLRASSGEYILHCDSDDWIELDMVATMYQKAVETKADIVCCNVSNEYGSHSKLQKYAYLEETKENGLQSLRCYDLYTAIWNKLVRRTLYFKHNIWHYPGINMGEDSAVTIRLRYFSKKTIIVPRPLYHYNRMNVNSMCAILPKTSIQQYMDLAKKTEDFFMHQNNLYKYQRLIDYLKFTAKQPILRDYRNYRLWHSTFLESHKSILYFKNLTMFGRLKWWICAYCYYPIVWLIK